ncbi:hypothetical protein MalM25_21950 [Planctomycetes bacterium MalM25]|nr:hypothetical protein MalM25_21950 [Planctomycetes bacterium MalM25]
MDIKLLCRTYSGCLICVCSLLLAGCGGDATMAPVEGVITFDGAPLADASVTFVLAEGGRPATGHTDSEGRYKLKTFEPGDGVKVGLNQVGIIAIAAPKQASAEVDSDAAALGGFGKRQKPAKQRWLIPPSYGKPGTSGLEFEVKPHTTNQADFELTSKK